MSAQEELVQVKPGRDSTSDSRQLQSRVAESLNRLDGIETDQDQTATGYRVEIPKSLVTHLVRSGAELDLADIVADEMGQPRRKKSNSFKDLLVEKLLKKNPGKQIDEK